MINTQMKFIDDLSAKLEKQFKLLEQIDQKIDVIGADMKEMLRKQDEMAEQIKNSNKGGVGKIQKFDSKMAEVTLTKLMAGAAPVMMNRVKALDREELSAKIISKVSHQN